MRIPNRIVGFLDFKDSKVPFEFEKGTFELKLYHPAENGRYELLAEGVESFGFNIKEHKWIDSITLKGKTSERLFIYFGTADNPSSYNGYLTYNVEWYYVTDDDSESIIEVRFFGREVNLFYNPTRIINQNIVFKKEKPLIIDSISVHTINCEELNCGQYTSGEVQVNISCAAYAINHPQSSSPLDSKSYLKLKFSKAISIQEMIDKARDIKRFITYVCYRTNNAFSEISTYINIEDGNIRNCGKLVFKSKYCEEQNDKAKERIIRAEYLNSSTAEILGSIEKDELPFGHFCNSIENMSHYPTSRIIMILAAFEREFRNIYGQDVRRSDEYKETKKEIIEVIENHAETLNGKQKKYAKALAKGILNSDSSYGDNFKYAMEDCKTIMEPFVISHFEGSYEEIIEDVSSNINELRNGIAHSRLDLELKARHLIDIKFVEEMLYAIRLKKIGIENLIIQRSINDLFRENMAL